MERVIQVYKIPWLLNMIYMESDKLIRDVTNTTRFEERCIEDIGGFLLKNSENKNKKRLLIRMIKRKAEEARRSFKREQVIYMNELRKIDENGEMVEFEPIDELGFVESEVLAKEMTALLGKDGRRKEIIEAWAVGNTNDILISRTLGRTFGGNSESHRKFIQRFRKECREQLSAVI